MTMERLSPGESSDRPSPPEPPTARDDEAQQGGGVRFPGQHPGFDRGIDPRQLRQLPRPSGTLSLRVQPADAEIFVNGDRWGAGGGPGPAAIELPEGRHRIEVRKNGFAPYAQDVLIRYRGTLSMSVDLQAVN